MLRWKDNHLHGLLLLLFLQDEMMPVVLRYQGYKFFFYSNEGNPLEPAHIHVRLAGKEAKF